MVVGLVFEHHEPLLAALGIVDRGSWIVDGHRNHDRGGVDFFGNFEVVEFTRSLQFAHADEGDVHQGDWLVIAAKAFSNRLIGVPCPGGGAVRIVEGDFLDLGQEGRVAAVVGPVGVQHLQLGDAGVTLFFVAEVGLAEGDIGRGHGEAEFHTDSCGLCGGEAVQDADIGRGRRRAAVIDGCHGDLVGIDGIDDVGFHRGKLFRGECALEDDHLGGVNGGTILAGENLYALGGGIRALVELTREILHGECRFIRADG